MLTRIIKLTNVRTDDHVTFEAPHLVERMMVSIQSQLCTRLRMAMSDLLSHISNVSSVSLTDGDFIFKERQSDGKLVLLFATALEADPAVPDLLESRDMILGPIRHLG